MADNFLSDHKNCLLRKLLFTSRSYKKLFRSEGENRGQREEVPQYKCNCFPPDIALCAVPRRWPSPHREFIWTYRATGSINSQHSPERSTRFMWKQGRGVWMLKDRMCGKRRNGRRWKLEEKAWKMSTVPEGQEQSGSARAKRDHREKEKNFNGFTSGHTFCSVGDIIQCNVCPHVSTHLRLEGHSERCWVGQDDISVCPLLPMVSSGRPHQQTGTTGSNRINLLRRRQKRETLDGIN